MTVGEVWIQVGGVLCDGGGIGNGYDCEEGVEGATSEESGGV